MKFRTRPFIPKKLLLADITKVNVFFNLSNLYFISLLASPVNLCKVMLRYVEFVGHKIFSLIILSNNIYVYIYVYKPIDIELLVIVK